MVTIIKQGDKRWSTQRLGNSNAKMARYGCAVSSCCMVLEKLRGYFCSPSNACRFWKFTLTGEILWSSTSFNGMKFVERFFTHNIQKLKYYANDKDKGAILAVNNNSHFVYVESVNGNNYRDISIIDPLDGLFHATLPTKYIPCGLVGFEKADMPVPAWMAEVISKAKEKGLDTSSPLTKLNIETLEKVLFDLKYIDKLEGSISLGRLLVIIEKIKDLE